MLTAGIVLMVLSIVIGVAALTAVAVMSPGARSAGRRTRTAMGLSNPEQDARSYDSTGEGAAYYQADNPYQADEPHYPAGEEAPLVAAVVEHVPHWVIVLVTVSGAGLVLGLLIVMIASIP